MGWDYIKRTPHFDLKRFIAEEHTYITRYGESRLIDTGIVAATTAYSAVYKRTPEIGGVFAYVTLIDYKSKKGWVGLKTLSELEGPVEANCPRKIFDLLAPLPEAREEGEDIYRHARRWRADCRQAFEQRLGRKEKLKVGNRLVPIEGDSVEIPGHGKFGSFRVHAYGERGKALVSEDGETRFKPAAWLVDKLRVAL